MMGGGLLGMPFALLFWILVLALLVAVVVWIFMASVSSISLYTGRRENRRKER